MSRPSSPDVVVVGAGFAGLYQLHPCAATLYPRAKSWYLGANVPG